MNKLLNEYYFAVQFTDVSGAEFLDLLNLRDELAKVENDLNEKEREILTQSDNLLLINCHSIHQELSRFIKLSDYRIKQQINPQQWWWYLDVLCCLPLKLPSLEKIPSPSLS